MIYCQILTLSTIVKKSLWKMPRVDVGNTHKSCKLVSEIQSQEIFHSMKDTNSSFLETFFNSVLIIDYIYTGINIIQRPTIPIATKIIPRWTISKNGILLPKLFWPTVRKNCSIDWEKLLKFKAEGWEFENFLRSLEQFIQAVKVQNNFR